jgi:AcrR family transcriptional regulator
VSSIRYTFVYYELEMGRKYELRQRAQTMEDTHRRIAEAAGELHGTVGPARTTVSAVAERAGVQRHTVYRHFPTEGDLYAACSGLFELRHPWPDVDAWTAIEDPRERLRIALDQLYRYYADTAYMWTRVLRDVHLVDAIEPTLAPFNELLAHAVEVLSSGWGTRGSRQREVAAAVRHATDLTTWRSLVEHGGISRRRAAELMLALVDAAAAR